MGAGTASGSASCSPSPPAWPSCCSCLLEQAPSHEVAVRVAGRILESMRPPFPLQGHRVQVGASVGVTVSEATDVDAVLREADVAMATAKARGEGRFELAATSA